MTWFAIVYLVMFALTTVQDRWGGVELVSYTEFRSEVQAGNVAEIFARGNTIEGTLRLPRAGARSG